MADKVTIGSLIVLTNRDSRQSPFAPANVPAPNKDPIEQNIPAPDTLKISPTSPAAQQPSQDPGKANLPAAQQPSQPVTPVTFGDKLQQVPKVTPTREAEPQPSQSVSLSRPPAEPVKVDQPTLPREMPFQAPPDISLSKEPADVQNIPTVVLSRPPADAQKPPDISTSKEPAGVTFLPDINLSKAPAEPIKLDDPPRTVVAADQPAPAISLTSPAAQQPSQDITLSKEPAKPRDLDEMPRTVVAAEQKGPDISLSVPPAEPKKLDEPPRTVVAAQQPTPDISLSKEPAAPQKLDDFPRTVEAAFQPPQVPGKPAEIGFEPPPTLSAPAILPPQPPPPPLLPAELPPPPDFKPVPNAVLPPPPDFKPNPNADLAFEPPPPPSKPADLPAPPDFKPNPNATLPGPPNFVPQPNAVLPAEPAPPPSAPAALPPPPNFAPNPNATLPGPLPFAPQPNATLPAPPNFAQPQPYAPGGQLDTPKDILGSLQLVDSKVKDFLRTLTTYTEMGGGEPGGQGFNPVLYAKELVRLGTQVGATGLASFAATQLGLFAMNRDGQIWNPATLAPPPFSEGFVPAAIDALFLSHEDKYHQMNEDRLKALGDGTYNDAQVVSYPPFVARTIKGGGVHPTGLSGFSLIPGPRMVGAASADPDLPVGSRITPNMSMRDALIQVKNAYTPDAKYEENADTFFSMNKLVNAALGQGSNKLIVSDSNTGLKKVDITKMYIPTPKLLTGGKGMGFDPDKDALPLSLLGGGNNAFSDATLKGAFFSSGIVPAKMKGAKGGDNDQGFILTTNRTEQPSGQIADDEAYVPLSFMDMRPLNQSNKIRTVYFRPFITNLSEEIAPEWNKQNYFGRVDAVASYMATARTINLGFIAYAFAPEDLEMIYNKLNWLISMTYPSYDKDILFKSGPVVKLRVGDVIKGSSGFGLPGIIESLSIDYNEMVWELSKDRKVPMGYKVSLSFLVLHEMPIGLGADGKFGGLGTIDPGTGKYSPPTKSQTQNAVGPGEAGPSGPTTQVVTNDVNSVADFRGFGSKINDYKAP